MVKKAKTMEESAQEISDNHKDTDWFIGCGVGSNKIVVYVENTIPKDLSQTFSKDHRIKIIKAN